LSVTIIYQRLVFFLFQGSVAESAAWNNLLPGPGGAEDDTPSQLQDDGRTVRIQLADRRLRVRVSPANVMIGIERV